MASKLGEHERWLAPAPPRRKPRRGHWDGENYRTPVDDAAGHQQLVTEDGETVLEVTSPDTPITTDTEEIP